MADVTRILSEMQGESRDAAMERLLPLIYDELRTLARAQLRHERPDHTLQPTALVHEAYLRLLGGRQPAWNDRQHFFRAAAEAMRRILVDSARRAKAKRRGGDRVRADITLSEFPELVEPDRLLELDEALSHLGQEDERAAEVARLRLFSGLSPDEAAAVLDVSPRTAAREWAFARARLVEMMAEGER